MKNVHLILAFIFFIAPNIYSQQSAKVQYEEIITLNIELPEDLPQDLLDKIPSQRVNHFSLAYDGNVAFYTNSTEKESSDLDVSSGDEENHFQLKMRVPKFTVYTNRDQDKFVSSRDFMGKPFLIVDKCRPNDWKITPDQKTVMDIPCIKATNEEGVVAWFAPSISAPHGPNGYGGLPGLILAMEFPENNREVLAKSIKEETINAEAFEQPKKGKKVSRNEFDALVEKKLEEMGAEGQGGMRIITIEEEN